MRIRISGIASWPNMPYGMGLVVMILCGALLGCLPPGQGSADTEAPEANRFTQHVVVDGLDEPMQMDFDEEGYVYWIERTGGVKRVHEETGITEELAALPVYEGRAPGLIGLLLDKNFSETRQLFLYYSPTEEEGKKMRLSRFTLGEDDVIDMNSEVEVLSVAWEQPDGEHMGGGMVWDNDGYLYLSIGDCTAPSEYAPIHIDEEDGSIQDAARTAGNTNDLRGSILRIDPLLDGSYHIPEGNLFPESTPDTRPEIYVMGSRNPWRLSIDSQTGYLHWGDVGPDAGTDSDVYGPEGVDEFNVAREAGNFGWPFVYGGRPYNRFDYETHTYGEPHDIDAPINDSPNNTGLRELPPAQPSLISYPYGVSEEWPILGSGARSAVGGPVFRKEDFSTDAPRVFPDYYEGKWLITDYVRSWIMVVTMNEERTEAVSVEPLVPLDQLSHSQPLDMDFGPTGDLYLVEYGVGTQGRISRIEYNDGNRAPIARAGAVQTAGAIPFEVQLSSEGTLDYDYDDDELHYEWTITPTIAGGDPTQTTGKNPLVTLEDAGRYQVELTVTDPEGASGSDSFEVVAGNEQPNVELVITQGNRSFYFPESTIEYEVRLDDYEDGSLADGGISESEVSFTAEYVPYGITPGQLAEMQEEDQLHPETALRYVQAENLVVQHGCDACHAIDSESVGPSLEEIAERYEGVENAAEKLSHSIIEGSRGEWGDTPMPPNPTISEVEVMEIVNYILNIGQPEARPQALPLQGDYTTTAYPLENGHDPLAGFFTIPYERGSYVLRARYTDRGGGEAEGLNLTGEDLILLRYPLLAPETADVFSEEGIWFTPSTDDPGFIVSGPKAYIGFEGIDLTGISQINIGALTRFWHWSHFVGAMVELRLGSPTGTLVGEPHEQVRPDHITAEDGPFFGEDLDPSVPVDVSEINGVHDVYVVLRNPEADPDDALLVLTGVEFKP